MTRRSECITAVMVLPAADACDATPAESARTERATPDTMVGSFQRKMWNMGWSPDVKLVKTRSFVMHAARYLGAITRCNSLGFETCTKRLTRQSGSGSWPCGECTSGGSLMIHFTNSSPIILVSIARCIEVVNIRLQHQENSDEPCQ